MIPVQNTQNMTRYYFCIYCIFLYELFYIFNKYVIYVFHHFIYKDIYILLFTASVWSRPPGPALVLEYSLTVIDCLTQLAH